MRNPTRPQPSCPLAARLLLATCILAPAAAARATGFHDETADGAEIMMKELRWPFWAKGTYFCLWYTQFHPNKYTTFYGGVATAGADKPPGMFMTYWNDLTNVHEGPYFYRHGHGAEGARGGANGKALFMKPGGWYRFVMRTFTDPASAESTLVGWWVKDVDNGVWHTHSVVKIPAKEAGFKRNGGFVEPLAQGDPPRVFERRLGYYRKGGVWHASHLSSTHPARFTLTDGGTVVHFETPRKNDPGPVKKAVIIRTKQPDQPVLDSPAIAKASAVSLGNQVVVSWAIPPSAAPQLRYAVEAFAAVKPDAPPVAWRTEAAPHVLAARLDTKRPAKSVRLTVTDIFDNVASVVAGVQSVTAAGAESVADTKPGLAYRYYEAPGGQPWEKLPDFTQLKPARLGYVKKPDDTVVQGRQDLYGLRYDGWIHAPRTGLYVFELGTCDGGRMWIDGDLVADNDGLHGTAVRQYPRALQEGLHRFELRYFRGAKKYLAEKVLFRWEGPGFARRSLSDSDFRCRYEGDLPTIALRLGTKTVQGVLADNAVDLHAAVHAAGHRAEKVQFFSGPLLLGTLTPKPNEDTLRLSTLLPPGPQTLTARLWYDRNHSISADAVRVVATNRTEGPWKFVTYDADVFPLGVRFVDAVASFRGEGFCFACQEVEGDFTITARIADIALSTKENGVAGQNWMGLLVKDKKPVCLERAYDGNDFGVFLTAGRGMKGVADFPDLGGGRMSVASYPDLERRWLRIVRRGRLHQAMTSDDGKTWEKVCERYSRSFSRSRYVGFCFRAVPGKSRSLFHGSLDHITLTRGAPPESKPVKAPRQYVGLKRRITALVPSPADPQTLYARGTLGLLRSSDRGETWVALDARAVRSVAVHPKDPAVLLRGGGGLWRSTDAGRSWKLATRDVDFDAAGPATLFGEVIRFNPLEANTVLAGGSTRGLFLSRDAGETWNYVGLKGQRITAIAFSPQRRYGRETAFAVGTFDDEAFAALGLPAPAAPLKGPGRLYHCTLRDGKLRTEVKLELEAFGVTNLLFDMHQNFTQAATTRGIYYTWMHGMAYEQRRHTLPADTLYVALGGRRFSDWTKLTCAAPFSAPGDVPVYHTVKRAFTWSALAKGVKLTGDKGDVAIGEGVTCVLPDAVEPKTIYLCNRHGVFKSTDGGRSYRLVYKCSP